MTTSKPGIRWCQFSLKTLLIVMLVVAAFFAGWGIAERRANRAIIEAREDADTARKEAEAARSNEEMARMMAEDNLLAGTKLRQVVESQLREMQRASAAKSPGDGP